MKVLVVNQILFTPEKGVIPHLDSVKDTMIMGLCRGLAEAGHEVTLLAAEEYRPKRAEDYGFEVEFLPTRLHRVFPPALLPYSPSIFKWMRRNAERFEMIISSETFSFGTLAATLFAASKTLIWQELNVHQRKMKKIPSRLWHNLIARTIIRRARCTVARSESARRFISRYMPRVSEEIVEHGIDSARFTPAEKKNRTLIASGQLIKRKNVASVIRKFAALHAMKPYSDVRLLIAGRGPEEESLRRLSRELGIEDCVDFKGFISQQQLGQLTASSLAFLTDTTQDLNMVSVPEAIMSGTPAVMNRVPASGWYVERFGLGIVRDDWDCNDLAQIIDHNEEYASRCVSYRQRLTSRYASERLIEIFKSFKPAEEES